MDGELLKWTNYWNGETNAMAIAFWVTGSMSDKFFLPNAVSVDDKIK
jgi:hypothetical protein